jgi:hypothetical protein
MIISSFEMAVEPRAADIVKADLKATLDLGSITEARKAAVWLLIDELEEAAWRSGVDEGYAHGWQDHQEEHR